MDSGLGGAHALGRQNGGRLFCKSEKGPPMLGAFAL
jgi:hypothetical protein